ncbi:MAG: hypothetical protein H6741_05840 [Alphaproteobacteria bacterium]|nr:hypothetical protein [Alphaproteobacteria bacterium]MCB9792229.1 hypothetical protein [Alphaproteobacteria bacterium]
MLLLLLACTAPAPELSPMRAALGGTPPSGLQEHLAATDIPEGFHVAAHAPFLVLGDMPQAEVERLTTRLVAWSDAKLRQDLFRQGPAPWVDVWLFSDAASYEAYVSARFAEPPDTPYGFANAEGLFMNIATGGGTLVHELVHPFVDADMPGAPPWINEGLGSLYEASAEREGHIVGLLNWRLPGLQDAIREERLGSFRALTALDAAGFYGEGSGDHYAQARYLILYLQEQGALFDFYAAARAHHAEDPSGYAALTAALGEADMAAFQARWEAWVMGLDWAG